MQHAFDAAIHVNQITPYSEEDAVPEDVKTEDKAAEDVKPTVASRVSKATQQANREKEEFLINFLTPLRPTLVTLRATKAQGSVKKQVPVPTLVGWINEIQYLRTTYKTLTMTSTPHQLFGKHISEQNWAKVIGRLPGYLKKAEEAHGFLQERKNKYDISQYLADEEEKAGITTLQETVNNKSWNKVYKKLPPHA